MKKILSTLLFAVALLVTPFGSLYAATGDPVHYWPFDDAGGRSVADVSGGQNGVMVGSSTGFGWSGGKKGTAIAIDGTKGLSVALPDGFIKGSVGTVSLWFRLDTLAGQNILFSGRATSDLNVYEALAVDQEGRPEFVYRTVATDPERKANAGVILNPNEWYHLVFSADSLRYRMWVNGVEATMYGDNTGRWIPDLASVTWSYRIAALESNSWNGVLSGTIDELRIYDRAITDAEVQTLYNEGNLSKPEVPLAIRPAVSLTTSDATVPYGGSVSLSWSSSNVTSCTASGDWSGPVEVSGTRVLVKIGGDSSYGLSCTGKGGTVNSSVSVHVVKQGEVIPPKPAASTGAGLSVEQTFGASGSTPAASAPGATVRQFARNLQLGARGDDVKDLQAFLIAKGFLGNGLATGYFGQMTKAAVVKFQSDRKLPATGFFGPMTRAVVAGIQ